MEGLGPAGGQERGRFFWHEQRSHRRGLDLNNLAPRAYTFTPYWNETADPALRKVLETVILDPKADVKALLTQAAKDAQAALDKLNK